MKNVRIREKLIVSFAVIILFVLFVSIVGIMTAVNMNRRMSEALEAAQTSNEQHLAYVSADAEVAAIRTTSLIIAGTVGSLGITVFFAIFLTKRISTPLGVLAEYMRSTAEDGDIVWRDNEVATLNKFRNSSKEIASICDSYEGIINCFNEVCDELKEVANGNLTIDVNVRSENDLISQELKKMVTSLNTMFGEINEASRQVFTGSHQIADGAQSLAQGSTQQAASVEQLSASVTEIAQKTKENASMAEKAAMLANEIKTSAEKGSQQMDEMMAAVKDINASSQNISKVIKSIDDIAFQTNILALNAAVEAARAGQHGKGFAVVAEEVRTLAAKSADAAKDTESLIADSIEKAELGSRIADDTAASLTEIVSGIGESSQLVVEIAKSSEEQSVGIAQVNTGIEQVAKVTQQNSATAQQSAAVSQEMSGQSEILESLVSRFKLKGGSSVAQSLPPAKQADGSYGKY